MNWNKLSKMHIAIGYQKNKYSQRRVRRNANPTFFVKLIKC